MIYLERFALPVPYKNGEYIEYMSLYIFEQYHAFRILPMLEKR